ncbi:hypothetical protein Tco_0689270 [Tanacetum coccineum]
MHNTQSPSQPPGQPPAFNMDLIDDPSSSIWDWSQFLDFNVDDHLPLPQFDTPQLQHPLEPLSEPLETVSEHLDTVPVNLRVRKRDPRMACSNFLAGRVPCACPELDAQLAAEEAEAKAPGKKKTRTGGSGSGRVGVGRCQVPGCEVDISELKGRTARISIPPIEPNLAERARIFAINLDDYQLDPVTPPPSPSSPLTMSAYQRMIDETDPTQREEALTKTSQNSVPLPETALTVCTTRLRGQLHTILEYMDRYPNSCLEELKAFMTLWDDAENRASNAQEEARHKRKEALEEAVQQIYRNHN